MFRKTRKLHMAMDYDEAMKILEEGEYGIVSTIGEDGYPYGIPMSYVLLDGNVYFHCALVGHKIDNIDYNDKVSFSVVGRTEVLSEEMDTNYESVILFGRATRIEGEEKTKALMELLKKCSQKITAEGKASIENYEDTTGKLRWGDQR